VADRHARVVRGLATAVVALGVPLIVFAGCGDLGHAELRRGVESLNALAAQGGLISDGVARDDTKSTYVRVMAKTLGGQAEHEAEKLADAEPSPGLGEERDAGVRIATDLADLFSELEIYPGDERRGALTRRQMASVGEEAEALAKRISEQSR
jgi:hypothetical protein